MPDEKQKPRPFVPKHILRKKQELNEWKSKNKGWLEELKRQGEISRRLRDEVFPKRPHDEEQKALDRLLHN